MPYVRSNIHFTSCNLTDITERENTGKKSQNTDEQEGMDILIIPWKHASWKKSNADTWQKYLNKLQFHFNYIIELLFYTVPF